MPSTTSCVRLAAGLLAVGLATCLLFSTLACAKSAEDAIPEDWLDSYLAGTFLFSKGGFPGGGMHNCSLSLGSSCLQALWPAIGNGYLGTIAQSDTVHVNGLYADLGPRTEYICGTKANNFCLPSDGFSNKRAAWRAGIPAFASAVRVYDEYVDNETQVSGLDLREGVFYERYALRHEGFGARVEHRVYAHRSRRNILVHEVQLFNGNARGMISVPLVTNANAPGLDMEFGQPKGFLDARGQPTLSRLGLLLEVELALPPLSPQEQARANVSLGLAHTEVPDSMAAAANGSVTLTFYTALVTSLEAADPQASARAQLMAASSVTPAQLRAEHEQAWAALWAAGEIAVETAAGIELELQQTVVASQFYLLSSTRDDWAHAVLSPSDLGHSGTYPHGFMGCTFWDQETFMAPPLLLLHQRNARIFTEYRAAQAGAYAESAAFFGLDGLYVPWTVAGLGAFAKDDSLNHIEIHVGADVALFLQQYWQQTKDVAWLRAVAWPLVSGIADFYVSRVNRTHSTVGRSRILTVIGPDEGNGIYSDDVYTNAAAANTMLFAAQIATLLGLPEKKAWLEVASSLELLFNASLGQHPGALGVHPEFDGYTGDIVGQTSVVLLGWPLQLPEPFASARLWHGDRDRVRYNDLLYYDEERVEWEGSWMSEGHYVVAWLERHHRNLLRADTWFGRSLTHCRGPWRLWWEHDRNGGGAVNFMTAAGLFLQSLTFGYAGARFGDDGLALDPVLPFSMKNITLRGLDLYNSSLTFSYSAFAASLTQTACADRLQILFDAYPDAPQPLHCNQPLAFDPQPFKIALASGIDALP